MARDIPRNRPSDRVKPYFRIWGRHLYASIEKPDSLGAETMATHTFNYSVPHSLRAVTHIFIFKSIYLDATNDEGTITADLLALPNMEVTIPLT
jgi:hypothetical protein